MKNSKMGGACSTYWEMRGSYRVVVGKPEGVTRKAILKLTFKKGG